MEKDKILDEIYEIRSYASKYSNKTEFTPEIGKAVYGEITRNGVNSIIEKFKDHFNNHAVFYDLGSGHGKMVFQIGLETETRLSIGVEYSKERFETALNIKNKYDLGNNILFFNKDMLKVDLSGATIIYIDDTVFPADLMKKLYNKIPRNCLLLYKNKMKDIIEVQQHDANLVERDYKQNGLYWLIKK